MIKCPNCAAELAFDAGSQMVKCPYCKSEFNPNELNEKVSKSEESNDTYEGKSYLCSQCGAKLLTFDLKRQGKNVLMLIRKWYLNLCLRLNI